MHYNRVLLLGTALTDPVKGKSLPERYWFSLGVRRDDNYKHTDKIWITGLISNLDNLANKRIAEFVRRGRLVMVEGVVQEWNDPKRSNKSYNVVLAKLIRVEIETFEKKQRRLLERIRRGES